MDEMLWVLEWSKRQNAFHIQPLLDAVNANAMKFAHDDSPNDYIAVCVGTRTQVEVVAEQARPVLKGRDTARRAA